MSQKTPISLMNELAKANSLEPEYKVLEEKGPAHKKTFLVELKLGEVGTWEGSGESIKKAKHDAAIKGLENCGLCIPDKPTIKTVNLTPTVELNGLAMKLGKTTQYRDLPPKPLPSHTHGQFPGQPQRPMTSRFHGLSNMQQDFNQIGYGSQRPYNQYNSYMYPRQAPRMMRVSLTVGDQEFIGEGREKQQARHNAAKKASELLREELQVQMASDAASPSAKDESKPDNTSTNGNAQAPNKDQDNPKSEVSLVYEIATHRKMLVDFADINNIGPAHMKKFGVRATVGQFVTEGEGLRKKDAKKDAAVKMLQELKNLPEIPEAELKRQKNVSKRNMQGGNRRKPKCELDPTLNPISILGQILQGRHEPAPVYSLVEERGHLSKKEFVLQVTVGNHKASGVGANKKRAKTNAAEAMLQLLGFRPTKEEKLVQQDGQNGNKTSDSSSGQTNNLSRQLKPGLLPMVPELAKQFGRNLNPLVAPVIQMKEDEPEQVPGILNRAPGTPVGNMQVNSTGKPLTKNQRLMQLADGMGLRVQFTNYPKPDIKGSQEFISLVTVSANPPLTCYGSGFTPEMADEEAANNALQSLLPLHVEHDALSQEQMNGSSAVTVPLMPSEPNDTPAVVIATE